MRFFPNNNIADSLFFSSHRRKKRKSPANVTPIQANNWKRIYFEISSDLRGFSPRDPKLALDFVLDDARVFLCGDLAVHDPGQPGPGHRRGHHGRSPTARHPREEDFLPSAARGLERTEKVPRSAGEGLCGGVSRESATWRDFIRQLGVRNPIWLE